MLFFFVCINVNIGLDICCNKASSIFLGQFQAEEFILFRVPKISLV